MVIMNQNLKQAIEDVIEENNLKTEHELLERRIHTFSDQHESIMKQLFQEEIPVTSGISKYFVKNCKKFLGVLISFLVVISFFYLIILERRK